jgi:hypothetical protein
VQTKQLIDEEDEDEMFLRQLVRPEEDRRQPSPPGGWRWFRSANVIDLVAYRRKRATNRARL